MTLGMVSSGSSGAGGSRSAARSRPAYKGYGLGAAVEILCGILSGTGWAMRLKKGVSQAAQFFMALQVEAFADRETFLREMSDLVDTLKSAEPAGKERVLFPGAARIRNSRGARAPRRAARPRAAETARQVRRSSGHQANPARLRFLHHFFALTPIFSSTSRFTP